MYAIFNLHVLVNTFLFIQRTEQVLIELDISAIEKYVIIIINCSKSLKSQLNGYSMDFRI